MSDWPWDNFPEDLSTWETCIKEHQQLRQQLEAWKSDFQKMQEHNASLVGERTRLTKQLAKARGALEKIARGGDYEDEPDTCQIDDLLMSIADQALKEIDNDRT